VPVRENGGALDNSRIPQTTRRSVSSEGYQLAVMANKLFIVPNPDRPEGTGVKKWRRTEIRIERREISIVRSSGSADLRCKVCGGDAAMVRADDAAVAFGIDREALLQWLNEGRVHGYTTPEGAVMVCAQSLRGLA
jgi:hypothetical protein